MLHFRKMIKWGGYMPISFEKIGQYLHYLSEVHGVQFCIKDFCGFVAINKQLDETLRPLSRAHKSILYVHEVRSGALPHLPHHDPQDVPQM